VCPPDSPSPTAQGAQRRADRPRPPLAGSTGAPATRKTFAVGQRATPSDDSGWRKHTDQAQNHRQRREVSPKSRQGPSSAVPWIAAPTSWSGNRSRSWVELRIPALQPPTAWVHRPHFFDSANPVLPLPPRSAMNRGFSAGRSTMRSGKPPN